MTTIKTESPDRCSWTMLLTAWVIALLATLGALFIGEVMGQAPCVLCWFQRAFMFPLAVILAVACYVADFRIWRYALPVAAIGWLVALYHSLLFGGLIPEDIKPCEANGPSCSGADMTILGVVPLPLVSLSAFTVIIILLFLIRRRLSE